MIQARSYVNAFAENEDPSMQVSRRLLVDRNLFCLCVMCLQVKQLSLCFALLSLCCFRLLQVICCIAICGVGFMFSRGHYLSGCLQC